MFGFGKKSATGIHVSGRIVRVAALGSGRGGVWPLALVESELESPFDPAALADDEQRQDLVSTLEGIADECGFDYGNTCISLDRRLALVKRRPLVADADKDNYEHLLWESEQILAEEAGEFSLDFVMTQNWGFVVAARYSALDCYLDLGDEAGFARLDVDLAPFALYNAGECAELLPGEELELLLYADVGEAWLMLVEEGEPLAVGSCTWEEEDEVVEVLEGTARKLLQDAGSDIQRVWGAGAGDMAWSEELAGRLGVPRSILDPLAAVDPDLLGEDATPEQRSVYAIAVGLAQRGLAG